MWGDKVANGYKNILTKRGKNKLLRGQSLDIAHAKHPGVG